MIEEIDPRGPSQTDYQSANLPHQPPPTPAATGTPSSSPTATTTVASPGSRTQSTDTVCLQHCHGRNDETQGVSPATPKPAAEPSAGDKIRRILESDPGWSTILSTAHAAYTAPNEIVSSFEDAARSNKNIATTIDHLASNWSKMSPADHTSAAADLLNLGDHTPGVTRAANVIAQANALPQRIAGTLTSWSQGNGLQRFAANVAGSPPGKWLFNRTVNALSPEAKGQLAEISSHYSSAAEEQLAQAAAKGGKLPFLHALSTTVGDVGGKLNNPVANALTDVPVLKDVPVVGAAISTASVAYDIGVDHENPLEAVGKEYGGLAAGQLAYDATLKAFSAGVKTAASTGADVAEGAVSDGAATAATDVAAGAAGDAALGAGAEAAGEAVIAGGPGTWAVAAGVGAAVAVGFAATKFIEGGGHDFGAAVTQGGGEIVSGIAHGNLSEVGTGFADGAKDVGKGMVDGGKAVVRGFEDVGSAIGSLI